MSTTANDPPGSGRRMSHQDKHESRDRSIEKILGALELGCMTTAEIADRIGMNRTTAHMHLMYMAEMGEASRGEPGLRGVCLWHLGKGADGNLLRVKRPVVPALQIGMVRDELVAALFGPA